MKNNQFISLCRRLRSQFPDFTSTGWLFHKPFTDGVLKGFACDGSNHDKRLFVIEVFALPLYIPTEVVYFNFGFRLKDKDGSSIWWNIEDSNLEQELLQLMHEQGLPFLEDFANMSSSAQAFRRAGTPTDPYCLEAVAYSMARTGDLRGATLGLTELLQLLDENCPWQKAMRIRANDLLSAIAMSPEAVVQRLEAWTAESVVNLGLGG